MRVSDPLTIIHQKFETLDEIEAVLDFVTGGRDPSSWQTESTPDAVLKQISVPTTVF
jgi:hypothetical protein